MTPETPIGNIASHASTAALAQAQGTARTDPKAAAEEFESVFISIMLNSMTSGLQADAPFSGGHAEETWRGLQNEEIAKSISTAGGLGIADAIYRELIAIQEGASQ